MKKKIYIIINRTQTKEELKKLIHWFINNYGSLRTAKVLDKLKELGFKTSTIAGISLGINDLIIPKSKNNLFKIADLTLKKNENCYKKGKINPILYIEKILTVWNSINEQLKNEIITNFREYSSINPLYIMTLSGARGNISQVKQLVGMRGLMSDSKGEIINLPIKHNFKEGLNLTEYFISCYGARKGLVDTALKTANSGYLTRRLIYVVQNQIIKKPDCKTKYKMLILNFKQNKKEFKQNKENLLGRIIANNVYESEGKKIILSSGQEICSYTVNKIVKLKQIYIRSPLTCKLNTGICQLCYGWNLGNGRIVELGETVGIIAAQSIGEPGTQLTMRTFHTGGIFSSEINKTLNSPHDGKLIYKIKKNDKKVRNRYSETALLTSQPKVLKIIENNLNICKIKIPAKSLIFIKPNQNINCKQLIAEIKKNKTIKQSKIHNLKEIKAPFSGIILISKDRAKKKIFIFNSKIIQYKLYYEKYKRNFFKNYGFYFWIIKNGKHKRWKNNRMTKLNCNLIKEIFIKSQKKRERKISKICHTIKMNLKEQKELIINRNCSEKYLNYQTKKLKSEKLKVKWLKRYSINTIQKRKDIILAQKIFVSPLKSRSIINTKNLTIKTNNILFYTQYEQGKTKDIVQGLPKVDQILEARKTLNTENLKENPHVKLNKIFTNLKKKYTNPQATRISILKMQYSLIQEIQSIYQSQGVKISNKHIEIIVKQMTSKVIIKEPGELPILTGEIYEINRIENLNKKVIEKAMYEPIILGISKLSLTNKSFVAAASFQETSKTLTKAAIEGKIDWLYGLKENLILSRLIPAGTGNKNR